MWGNSLKPNAVPVVSIIIVNWNGEGMIERCLRALENSQTQTSFETIVVDNASTDNSPNIIREQFPEVKLLVSAENGGFGKGNNQGLPLATGKYYLLLNSDAFVHQGTLDAMVQLMESQEDIGVVGCKLLHEDGALQRSCYNFPTLATELWWSLWLDRAFSASKVFGKYEMLYWDMEDVREVDSVMAACVLLRKEAIDQVGLFDERFFMYSEEVDLYYRLKRAGWKIFYTPHAVATHIWGGSTRKTKLKNFLQLYRSRVLFFRKHYGVLTTALYKLLLAFASTLRVIGGWLVGILRRNREAGERANLYGRLFIEVWSF
jgi:GT2 family glycosyltransferase